MADEFNFMRRKCKLEKDGPWIQPGNYIQQMLRAYEEQVGKVKLQQLASDNPIQMEGKSEILNDQEKISLCRSIVGSVRCGACSQGIGFKNVRTNNYVLSSLEEAF